MSSDDAQRQLRLMTYFLGFVAAAVVASVVVGAAFRPKGGALVSAGVVPKATTTTVPPTTAPPSTTTTVTTTGVSLAPRLVVQTEQEIAGAVAPKVAFLTTLNGSGSGVLVEDDLIVTSAHVVWPFRNIGVLFPGDTRRGGTVIGIDPRADVALVEVRSPKLPDPVEFGDTGILEPGGDVFVVGYPAVESVTPDPTVVTATYRETIPWTFSGVSWTVAEAPAVGGQSGGALLDEYGRLVGITTFGSAAEIYSVTSEDLQDIVASLRSDAEESVDERLPPRRGGRLEFAIELAGPWEQAAFVTWLSPGVQTTLASTAGVSWRALDAFGFELATGSGALDVVWPAATPGIVLATSGGPTEVDVTVNRPLVAIDDPDDGQVVTVSAQTDGLGGFVDVAGDRDWWYLDLEEDAENLEILVQAQTRVRISLYNRTTKQQLAAVDHQRGFLFTDPALETGPLPAGSYVIAIEDIAAQFGTYSLQVNPETAHAVSPAHLR